MKMGIPGAVAGVSSGASAISTARNAPLGERRGPGADEQDWSGAARHRTQGCHRIEGAKCAPREVRAMATKQVTGEIGSEAAAPTPPRPETAARPSGWTAGRIAALVIGALLVLLSLILLGGGGTALWADRTQRDEGYVTTDVHEFSASGSALATVSTELGSAGVGWLDSPALMDEVRIRVTSTSSGPLFVGIAPSTEVDRYLAGVHHTVITEFWDEKTQAFEGSTPASAPGTQDFWVASAIGSGPQTVLWDPADGSWTVVVMNADARPGIAVEADLGARMPAVLWIAVGLLAAGAVFMAGGALLITGAIRGRRASQVSTT
jgi:hypothetical protein